MIQKKTEPDYIYLSSQFCILFYKYQIYSCQFNYQQMNKIRRTSTNTIYQGYSNNLEFNKSPLRRNNNINQHNIARSPIRSRTPIRHVSPIKNTVQNQPTIKFISNLSPLKDKYVEYENVGQFSNGKSIKFINNFINDKFYQSNRRDKNQEFNKKSERIMQDQNRLFGKLVDKMNSGKKNALKSNQNSQKTSLFVEISDKKQNKFDQNSTKNESQLAKSPFKTIKETKPQTKNIERNKETRMAQQENLSCLVYKVKSTSQRQEEDKKSKKEPVKVLDKNSSANVPSILLKKKVSKNEDDNEKVSQIRAKNVEKNPQKENQEQDFSQLNIFLKKIQQGCKGFTRQIYEDDVKRSFKVQQSLNMEPFL